MVAYTDDHHDHLYRWVDQPAVQWYNSDQSLFIIVQTLYSRKVRARLLITLTGLRIVGVIVIHHAQESITKGNGRFVISSYKLLYYRPTLNRYSLRSRLLSARLRGKLAFDLAIACRFGDECLTAREVIDSRLNSSVMARVGNR